MKIWFPDFYTEAHRTEERQLDLVLALLEVGVQAVPKIEQDCELCFCGSIFKVEEVIRNRQVNIPVVHYNWDLYPRIILTGGKIWKRYLSDLKSCSMILVPGKGTEIRTKQYINRESEIVLAPVKVWDVPNIGSSRIRIPGTYYLDVMRDYPWDPNFTLTEQACSILKVDLVKTRTREDWNTFKFLVANAKALLSCCHEASTGGLTLLEGYAHGVPVVACDSPLNGVRDYFGDRALYCKGTTLSLIDTLSLLKDRPDPDECRRWVIENYSDLRFAERLKECFLKCVRR